MWSSISVESFLWKFLRVLWWSQNKFLDTNIPQPGGWMCTRHWWLLCNSSSLVSYSHHNPFLYKIINISTFKKLILEYSGLKGLGWPGVCCFLQQESSLPLLSSNRISYKWHEKPENLLLLPSLGATEKDGFGFSLWLHFLFSSCKKKCSIFFVNEMLSAPRWDYLNRGMHNLYYNKQLYPDDLFAENN